MGQVRAAWKIHGRLFAHHQFLATALGLAALLLYVRTLAPGVLDGDSGEWQYMANILGVAHSTGYPLYLLLAKIFTLIPLGNPAWRVNFFSAACAAASLPFVYALARRFSGSRAAALIAASLFALAPTLWASAVEAEVYALNTLLLAIALYLAVRWYDTHYVRYLFGLAFAFGLALDNHRVALFIAPALLLLLSTQRRWLSIGKLAAAAALVILPLLLYLYIPLRASQLLQDQSTANWALYPRSEAMLKGTISAYYNNTPYGIINLITGFDNRNKLGFQDDSTDSLAARLINAVALLIEQFNPLILILALIGLILMLRRERAAALFMILWAVGISAISIELRAQSTRFYFSGAYLVVALFLAMGVSALLAWSQKRYWSRVLVLAGLIAILLVTLVINFASMDRSGFRDYDTYARSVLGDNLASNAVVIAPWEIATGLRYLQFVEGQRPDLLIIHESPVRPQFDKLLGSARSLGRSFYYVQFNPEDRTDAGTRTVEAVGLPLLTVPAPKYSLGVDIIPGIRVLGYDLKPDPAAPGQMTKVFVYYQVTAPTTTRFIADLSLTDIRGDPHGDWEHSPVSQYYPTYYWKPGEYYRDVWDVPFSVDAPKGLYSIQLSWYPFDSATNATRYDRPRSVSFGPIRAGDFSAGLPPSPLRQVFANGMTLLGFGVQLRGSNSASTGAVDASPQLRRGQPLTVALYWTASRPISGAYTVFIHLEDSSGAVRAQSDRPPWNGMFPTDRWTVGESVRDDYVIQIPANLEAGEYALRVGVYQTPDMRVPLLSSGDQVLLSQFRLTEQ